MENKKMEVGTSVNSNVSAASSNGEQENGPISTSVNSNVSAASSNGEQENGPIVPV